MDPKDKKPAVASAVVIKHSEFPDLILHGKRKDTNSWSIPGGHVHKHESLKDAAVRETREETGLQLDPKDLEHIGTEHYRTQEDNHLTVHLFVCKKPYHHESMDFTGDKDEEFKELKFINPLEHDDLYQPNGENIVTTYLKGELKKPEISKAEELDKDQGRITFNKLKTSTRPDQEVRELTTPRQFEIAARSFSNKKSRGEGPLKGLTDVKALQESMEGKIGGTVVSNKGKFSTPFINTNLKFKDKKVNPAFIKEHEGFHHLMNQVRDKYGHENAGNILNTLVSYVHPEDIQNIESSLKQNGYRKIKGDPISEQTWNEEIINRVRDFVHFSGARKLFPKETHGRIKNAWRKMQNTSKNISLLPNSQNPEKLAATEKSENKNIEVYQFFHNFINDLIKVEVKDKNNLKVAETSFKIELGDLILPQEIKIKNNHNDAGLSKEIYKYANEIIDLIKKESKEDKKPKLKKFKRFYLNRKVDHNGKSGTGIVAVGVQFPGGKCLVNWMTDTPSFNFYESLDDIKDVHGHDGDTEVQFMDESDEPFGKSEELEKAETQPTTLYHYSREKGLKMLDPKKQGMGVKGDHTKRALPYQIKNYPHVTFYYINDTPEDIVRSAANAKYTVKLEPHQKLYDIYNDPEGLAMQAVKENQMAWNYEKIFNKIKDAGYHGIISKDSEHPVIANTVMLFHPHPVHEELKP